MKPENFRSLQPGRGYRRAYRLLQHPVCRQETGNTRNYRYLAQFQRASAGIEITLSTKSGDDLPR